MFEKVNPAHPDKIADRIAGALVDLAYAQEKNPKIAVEVLIGHGMCHVIAETSVHLSVEDIRQAVQRIAGEGVVLNYHEVRQDPILSGNQQDGLRCGDNGIFKGVPVTVEQHMLADIARDLYSVFPTDGKFRFISDTLSTVLDVILNTVDFFIAVFSGDWEGAWEAVKNIFSSIWNGLVSWFTNILETIKGVLDVALGWIGTSWEQVWTNVKNFFTNIWNGIKDFISSTINSISTTISNVITGIKTTVNNVFSAIKTTISNIFNGIKDTATSVWNAIKTAITTPIENAKEKVREAINAIKGFFSGLKLELPHIKLPHFSISGSFSLSPPSVPHINIDWYKSGGIMAGPTIFGMNGSSLMAGGEAGKEAILPLTEFYSKLESILTSRLNTGTMERYLAVIAANSGKGIYLDDGTLVGHLLPAIDSGLANYSIRARRGNR